MSNGDTQVYREEYIYLAGLTHNSVMIAWGAFFFKVKGKLDTGQWEIIKDKDLHKHKYEDVKLDRRDLIGQWSAPYAKPGTDQQAPIEVVITEKNSNVKKKYFFPHYINDVTINNLSPDTDYTYKVILNGKEWGSGPLRDWEYDKARDIKRMAKSSRSYKNEFRTFPDPTTQSPLTFAIIGDFGRGVREGSSDDLCQSIVAKALTEAVEKSDIRLILTTGDNIYDISQQGSGDQDSDWFYTYFQPYRYIINRVPVYPCVGNHDEGETESSDDRSQIYSNFYLGNRFPEKPGEVMHRPGLFYRFRYGSDIEFICLDTSNKSWFFGKRFYKDGQYQILLEAAFPANAPQPPKWRIPFFHHPPFCAGPAHHNDKDVISDLVPKFERAKVRVAFCGHEHNFQHSVYNGISYFVTGGAGKYRKGKPDQLEEAKTKAWGGNDEGHFLLVSINGDRMEITPVTNFDGQQPKPLKVKDAGGNDLEDYFPFEIRS